MGGNNYRQRKSSSTFSICSWFKTKRSNNNNNYCDEAPRRKVFSSDEDRGYWVGEPGIDRKASNYIAKFHEARRFEAQIMALPTNNLQKKPMNPFPSRRSCEDN
ncbi:hypothetical protein RND81_12G160700 [Saponaria officinalis]|uniref:Uncharacterized protein n=1 Tax=Saponaria officinalis TaxID=3572 RepID=A0AAW1HB82_SAPOF